MFWKSLYVLGVHFVWEWKSDGKPHRVGVCYGNRVWMWKK